MKSYIQQLLSEVEVFSTATADGLEQFRIRFFGKKGELSNLFEQLKTVAAEDKKELGVLMNKLKIEVQNKIDTVKLSFNRVESSPLLDDLSRPSYDLEPGHRHPLSQIRSEIIDIFSRIGFVVVEDREIEDDWHNFSALNFAPEHPAREMQDTFFVQGVSDEKFVLRTHTSSVQIRMMENQKPPIRAIFPGRVYRNEAISARAHCFFHQIEGLYIDKGVSFADLQTTLLYFAKEMFSADTRIRLRPSYFPFTEPSAEMDISCNLCSGKGCSFCKHTGWVEILGCGMVDPNVLENCGIDPNEYSGFAFGMGLERMTNLKYTINDLRLFSENDVRFLKQF